MPRLLFYKASFGWPRSSGHDVHTYYMMRALTRLGATVGLVTARTPPAGALDGIALHLQESLGTTRSSTPPRLPLGSMEERYRSYWGVPQTAIARFAAFSEAFRADAVVVCGLDALPMLGCIRDATRIWYAADEWFVHHVSQVRWRSPRSWGNLRDAAVKLLYERAYRHRIDRVWVVSPRDAAAMRWIAGNRTVDVLPNGVDTDFYRPSASAPQPDTIVFWGRLDFGPNVQALEWFCERVWPHVRTLRPHATFTIVGFSPNAQVRTLAAKAGVALLADVENLPQEVARHAVVVLPFVSGGGIKNKLLEAAAMGKPIVCSPTALIGLRGDAPVTVARNTTDWIEAVRSLWDDPARRQVQGHRARAWVEQHHRWEDVAASALRQLGASDAAQLAFVGADQLT